MSPHLRISPQISPHLAQGWLFEKKAAEPFWSVWSKHALGRVHWLRTFPGLADTVGTCTILTISPRSLLDLP